MVGRLFLSGTINLNIDRCYVLYGLRMPNRNTVLTIMFCSLFVTHLLDHLDAQVAGLTGGQVAVVAIGQVDTDLGSLMCILNLSMASRAWGTLI